MLMRKVLISVVTLCTAWLSALGATNVTTWRYDNGRTGQNLTETQLTPANVGSSGFGKLFSYGVDGYVYAQPLYMAGINIAGNIHNVVFIATEHDSVFAMDADQNLQLWKASLIDGAHGAPIGATTVPSADVGTSDLVPEIGVTGTPVIDPATNTLYVVAKSKESGKYVQRLHALDLATGNEKTNSPVVIQGSVPGTGSGTVGGNVAFQPLIQLNRPGLLLVGGNIYIAFGSHGDLGAYHGWVFAYDASSLQQTAIYNSSPNGSKNGIWQAGAGLATDTGSNGSRIFLATGNGSSNPSLPYTNSQAYGEAVVRFDLSSGGLHVSDEWTAFDQSTLTAADRDEGSGGVLLLPDQPGSHIHELIQVGKNGRIEVLDRDNLGGYNTSFNNIAQELNGQVGGMRSTPAYWNGNVYFWGEGDKLKQFSLNNGQLSSAPTATGSVISLFPGASAVVSSNGTSNGILWAIRSDAFTSGGPSILYAFSASSVSTLLYSSNQNSARDSAGAAVKFAVPVVTNGKVYVGAQGEVNVYGLLASAPPSVPTPIFTPSPGVYSSAQNVTISDTLSGAAIYYTTDGTTPTTASLRYSGAINVSTTTTLRALATASGYNNSSVGNGIFTISISTAPEINFSNGFSSTTGLTLNGSAVNAGTSLQLTPAASYKAGSAFWNTPVNVQSFTTDFTFQLSGTAPIADGITFTIQNTGATALGPSGGGLGYGPNQPNGVGGIPKSVAIKFDLYSNAGEGNDSTGIYTNGASPTTPFIDLTNTGINLSNGDTFAAHMTYDGTMLNLTLTDQTIGAVYSHGFAINIPQIVGSNTALVGFTGGTGLITAAQKILTWTFASSTSSLPALQYEAETLNGKSSGPAFRTFSWNGFPDGKGTVLDSTKAGDSITFTASVASAGTYDLQVTSKNYYDRGIWQLSIDGINVGSAQDEYSAIANFADFDLGPIVLLSAGNHTFQFTVTGKNTKSTGFSISFDYLKLTPL